MRPVIKTRSCLQPFLSVCHVDYPYGRRHHELNERREQQRALAPSRERRPTELSCLFWCFFGSELNRNFSGTARRWATPPGPMPVVCMGQLMSKRRRVKLDGSYRNPNDFYCEMEVVRFLAIRGDEWPDAWRSGAGSRVTGGHQYMYVNCFGGSGGHSRIRL